MAETVLSRWRQHHDEAHNGDIYRGGEFPCSLCPAALEVPLEALIAIEAAAQAEAQADAILAHPAIEAALRPLLDVVEAARVAVEEHGHHDACSCLDPVLAALTLRAEEAE